MNESKEEIDPTEVKARRGWWASVAFMLLIVALIVFLSYVKIVEENRDILVGIIGMITGSISSMLAIASGRDPSEVDELRESLSRANADRAALIARLRDSQIQLQLLRDQIGELQQAMIDKLSIFQGDRILKTKSTGQVILHPEVEEMLKKLKVS